MKDFPRIERLQREWGEKFVEVDPSIPTLRRFAGRIGQVMTVNMNGDALVQFTGTKDVGWYDISLDRLRIVAQPLDPVPPKTKGPAEPAGTIVDVRIESVANVREAAERASVAAEKPKKPALSTADILAAARSKKSVGVEQRAPAAPRTPASDDAVKAPAAKSAAKLSTADILAAARAGKKSETSAAATGEDQPTKPVAPRPAAKLTTEEILAMARREKDAGGEKG